MKDISFNLSGKLDPLLVEVISLIDHEATGLGIPFFIVGAMARDIVLELCYKLPARRSTRDLDIGVEVAGWEEYQRLSMALVSSGRFVSGRAPHVLRYGELRVDIVPFGEVSADHRSITWPPDHTVVMNILGFKEAYENSLEIQMHDDPFLAVKVPTVPGMALMKIISWHDRYPERQKDAEDLLFITDHYAYAGNEDRLFGPEIDVMEEEEFDLAMAGIRLLGRDMARIVTIETRKQVVEILAGELDDPRDHGLIRDMARPSYLEGKRFEEVRSKLERVRQGFVEASNDHP
ncbi:MAG: nucleotidyl transferase AbiEii/AbiGii toxin family protein [Pseudomonadota bacterium]|nr:nucleotidyl transferase AbiEii/AbiGii toxin family protein [Pseudomonadota bacterium]